MSKYNDMMKEYKAKGGKVTVCPTKYNNIATNVKAKPITKVTHYKNRMAKPKVIGICKENISNKYYK